MKAYSYSLITKEYVGEVNCQPNPLEGGYLLPACSTLEKPPITTLNQVAVWNNEWEIKDDNRGQIYWDKTTKEEIKIIEIGIVKDDNWTEIGPISNRCIWEINKWVEPPLTIEEQEAKEKEDYIEAMPDLVKNLEVRIAILENK